MKRRDFITLLGGAAAAWPVAARAQEGDRIRRIGILQLGSSRTTGRSIFGQIPVEAFKRGLAELGWIEGRNIRFEERWADGNLQLLPTYAAELARLTTRREATQLACAAADQVPVRHQSPDGQGARFDHSARVARHRRRGDRMIRRRAFISLLGNAAAWPLAARAQQAKLPVIGFLVIGFDRLELRSHRGAFCHDHSG